MCSQASRSLPVSSKRSHSDSDQDTDSRDSTCTSEDGDSNCVKYPTPDQRIFSGSKYENSYEWLYYSVSKAGYCCRICELFSPSQSVCGKSLAFIERGVILGTHPSRKLKKHEESTRHKEVLEHFGFSKAQPQTKKRKTVHLTLVTSETKQKEDKVKRNREYMKKTYQLFIFHDSEALGCI